MSADAPMRLSILDQSPVIGAHSASDALAATLELAQAAEALGYARFWLAEHHGLHSLADPCPEILLARIGSLTRRIRIGTGGVLLPYYSPFKVAEQFRMLEALFPGRVDLGIGRAPGGDARTARALSGSTTGGSYQAGLHFPQQVAELVMLLEGGLPDDHPHAGVPLQPAVETAPEVWILGSSDYGGALAAQLGLRFAYAHFINPRDGETVAHAYRRDFRAAPAARPPRGALAAGPRHALALFCICADTQREADELAAAVDVRRLQMAYGINAAIPTIAEARARLAHLSERDRLIIEHERPRSIIGTPQAVADRAAALAERHAADEVVVLTVAPDYHARLRSCELLAAAWAGRLTA